MLNNAKIGSVAHRNDTAENWAKAVNFIPKKGELIIYNPDAADEPYTKEVTIAGKTYTVESSSSVRFKFGNGIDNVNALPFAVVIDNELDVNSTNPIQNKVVTAKLNAKANASSLASKADSSTVNGMGKSLSEVISQVSNLESDKLNTNALDLLMAVMIEGTPTYFKVMKVDGSSIPENERLNAQSQ